MNILLVCSNSYTLSPLLAAILQLNLEKRQLPRLVTVQYAGMHSGQTPRAIDRNVRKLAQTLNVQLDDWLTNSISRLNLARFDLILLLNEQDYNHLVELQPEHQARIKLLPVEYAEQLGYRSIPDPGLGDITYPETVALLEQLATCFLQRLEKILLV